MKSQKADERQDGFPVAYSREEAEAKAVEIVGRVARLNPCWLQTGPGISSLQVPK
jgi:hypothetical protein